MRRYIIPVLACATLGIAPFGETPHLLGKLRWVAGGAEGMALLDWGDLLLHGFPFVLLFLVIAYDLFAKPKHRISGKQARKFVDEGALLLDVRSPAEFASGHLDNAVNIPVAELSQRMAEVPTDRIVVLYCASGMRSGLATSQLQRTGRDDVFDMGAHRNWPS